MTAAGRICTIKVLFQMQGNTYYFVNKLNPSSELQLMLLPLIQFSFTVTLLTMLPPGHFLKAGENNNHKNVFSKVSEVFRAFYLFLLRRDLVAAHMATIELAPVNSYSSTSSY